MAAQSLSGDLISDRRQFCRAIYLWRSTILRLPWNTFWELPEHFCCVHLRQACWSAWRRGRQTSRIV